MADRPIGIMNGTLIDGTGKPPIQDSSVVIFGSKIIEVGPSDEVDIPKGAKVLEAQGKTIIPGFIDSHTHFIIMGIRSLTTLNLSRTRSISEVVERVKAKLTELPKGTWLNGHGFDESVWSEKRYPTKDDLDPVSPDNPVALTPFYGHLASVNTRALELIQINKETPDPPGGKIDRDPVSGEATGVLREEAIKLIDEVKPPTTQEDSLNGLQKACEIALRWGCTSIHELGSDPIDISTYQTACENGILKVRSYVMPTARFTEKMLDGLEALGVRTRFGNEVFRIGSVKIYVDGSMGARTAVFFEPYADDPSTTGIFNIPLEDLEQRVVRAHKLGLQVAIHAIGDRGIEEALNAIEAALGQEWRADHRHRIEHCEILTEDQIHRIKRLEIVPSMQPNFIGEWGQPDGMYEQRLGLDRLRLSNPYRKMLDEGIKVAFGSDCGYCPPWPFNPLYGIWSAVFHPIEESRISLEEAVKCYTLYGAYASFEEDIKGSIEPGKLADIAILSEDLSVIPPEQIKNVEVDLTMVGGKIHWQTLR
ncbi:MAG: amidohydrolase [Candidatus Heimdallarchaeota archaeon]